MNLMDNFEKAVINLGFNDQTIHTNYVPSLNSISEVFNSLHILLNNFDIRFNIQKFINLVDTVLVIPVTNENWELAHELFDTSILGCIMHVTNNNLYWAKWIYNKLLWKKKAQYFIYNNGIYKLEKEFDFIKAIEKISETYITAKALYTMRLIFIRNSYTTNDEVIEDRATMQNALIFLNKTIEEWIEDPVIHPLFYNPIFTKIAAYNLTYHDCNNAFLLHEHGKFYNRMLKKLYEKHGLYHVIPKDKRIINKKKKIGFVSRFLFQHSVGKVATGIIEQLHLRNEFEIHIFAPNIKNGDPFSEILAKSCEVYHGFDKEGQIEWINAILQANIDILVFLDPIMDINTYILANFKICPIYIATWGHPETSGLETMDYYISSKIFEKNVDYNYTEKLIQFDSLNMYYYNPNKFLNFNIHDMLQKYDKKELRKMFNFPDCHIYAVTCPALKISPIFEQTICKILTNDPNGIVVMTQDINPFHFQNIVNRFNTNMTSDICKRIITTSFINDSETFYKFIYSADVILDPFPFGGLISTIDIFSCGKAIITRPGNKLYGRFTYGLYNYMQIPKKEYLIANTIDEYVEKAIRIASVPIIRNEIENAIVELLPTIFEDNKSIDEWTQFLHSVTDSESQK
jgi:predicted O-linked N-acetylglucosamine transferase (SPINDLY family)